MDFLIYLFEFNRPQEYCYDRVRSLSYQNADMFLIVFDIVNRPSFEMITTKVKCSKLYNNLQEKINIFLVDTRNPTLLWKRYSFYYSGFQV